MEEVEGLQETLAKDLENQQEILGGKRDAEETDVGTPIKKRKYARATAGIKKELEKREKALDLEQEHLDKKMQALNEREEFTRQTLENEQHDVLLIEGQGSLVHPSHSAVTLGILHGSMPHALVLCYEVLRDKVTGVEHVAIPDLPEVRRIVEVMSNVHHDCEVIGVSMNSRRVTEEEALAEQQRVGELLNLPVTDIFRFGRESLVDAVLEARERFLAAVSGLE